MGSLFAVLLWRPSGRWDNNIKMDINETGYEDVDLICLAQDCVQSSFRFMKSSVAAL
jgi:hypothetical protein